jgi:hypothetical protein
MSQTYVSASNTFSFEYPDDWKLEKEDGGALVLRKKGGLFKKDGQNCLRITPMVSDQMISPGAYTALLNLRRKEHQDLEVMEKSDRFTMNFHILKYKTESYQDVDKRTYLFINDYWELIISNRIFTCVFAARQDEAASPKTLAEKETVEQILFTLKLL